MAESVVLSVFDRIGSLLIKEAQFLDGVSEEVEQLQSQLRQLLYFLEDADAKQDGSERIRDCVSEIRDAAYDAEDIIESFVLKVASRSSGSFPSILKRYSCFLIECIELHKLGSEIKVLKSKISNLTANLQTHGVVARNTQGEGSSLRSMPDTQGGHLRQSYGHIVEDDTVGLEENVEKLVGILVREENRKAISIYGMGGLGKTTLAKKIYHHKDVMQHFECLAWAYVSQQFHRREILEGIFLKLTSKEREEIVKLGDVELVEELYRVQEEKKCLVILDDVWSAEVWDNLKAAFPLGKAGSKVLLTTRKKDVASCVDPQCFLHEPSCLNDKESWELLQKKAFTRKDDFKIVQNIEEVMAEMVGYCKGLPLAIIVLGGLLASKHTLNEWITVQRNIKSYLRKGSREKDGGVSSVLALSYYDLPLHLKQCFLYLAHFPENSEITTKNLLRRWIAEGFVSPSRAQYQGEGEESLEDIAERYLVELLDRCMIQVGQRESTGRVKTCCLHDLMREFCLLKAEQENFLTIIHFEERNDQLGSSSMINLAKNIGKIRRLAFYFYQNITGPIQWDNKRTSHLRSLLFFGQSEFQENKFGKRQLKPIFSDFKLLRVLDLERCEVTIKLPRAIGNLIHLRYLSLAHVPFTNLPSSIGNLRCLQTLYLTTWKAVKVPNVIWRMKQLRHLYLPHKIRGKHGKLQFDTLRSLETLKYLNKNICVLQDLIKLTKLRKLGVTYLDSLKELLSVLQPMNLNRLLSLFLSINVMFIEETDLRKLLSNCRNLNILELGGKIENLPKHHHFPPTLTKLTLLGSELEQDPIPTLEKLPNLRILRLGEEAFVEKIMVCSSDGFLQLKSLELRNLLNLEEWRVEQGALPSLSHLEIEYCSKLNMVPDGLRFITTLWELKIILMPHQFEKRLHTGGEDFLKVQHVPSIIIQ